MITYLKWLFGVKQPAVESPKLSTIDNSFEAFLRDVVKNRGPQSPEETAEWLAAYNAAYSEMYGPSASGLRH
jgi:hypothetical protein